MNTLKAVISMILLINIAVRAVPTNILFFLSDDHSVPFLNCYGQKEMKTPNLDKLAAEGIKFTKMFTSAPQCVPSRATIMTGRSPVACRITRFSSPLPRDEINNLYGKKGLESITLDLKEALSTSIKKPVGL